MEGEHIETLENELHGCLYQIRDLFAVMDEADEPLCNAARSGMALCEHAEDKISDLVVCLSKIIGEIRIKRFQGRGLGGSVHQIEAIDFSPSELIINAMKKSAIVPGGEIRIAGNIGGAHVVKRVEPLDDGEVKKAA